MHCQCCNRKILANTGVIAHHGYERPGHGWQTSSCMGARHLPFEVDRTQLGLMIEFLRKRRKDMVAHLAATRAEKVGVPYTVTIGYDRRFGKSTTRDLIVTRANFARARATAREVDYYRHGMRWDTFDQLKAADVAYQASRVKDITSHIKQEQARYDGWKQTHRREGDLWVAI